MRRTAIAVFMVMLAAVPAGLVLAQSPDPLITSARQLSQQGNHDTAISLLRSGLASRPDDALLKGALADALQFKRRDLMQQAAELSREIATLRPPRGAVAGCGEAAEGFPPPSAPIRVGGPIVPPKKVHDVKPAYPPDAMAAKVQGIVIMEVTIDCAGNVASAQVLRGNPMLNDAALLAVRQWRYTETLLNGVPVPVIMTVTMTFNLQ